MTEETYVTCLALHLLRFSSSLRRPSSLAQHWWVSTTTLTRSTTGKMGPPSGGKSSTPTPAPLDSTSTKDTYIPLFSGAPQDYKEWRKRIHVYFKKMEITNRKAEAVLNLIGSLQGTAWKLVEDFNLDDAGKDTAFRDILKKLDSAFQYDARVQLPNDFDNYFNMHRTPGQTLLQYVTTHDELYRRIGDHNNLPVAVQGWHLLRRANLSKEQRQLVMTQSAIFQSPCACAAERLKRRPKPWIKKTFGGSSQNRYTFSICATLPSISSVNLVHFRFVVHFTDLCKSKNDGPDRQRKHHNCKKGPGNP